MNIINLTPHPIVLGTITIQSTGQAARVKETAELIHTFTYESEEVQVKQVKYLAEGSLPAPIPDTLYVVSVLVAQANPDRTDLVIPYDVDRDAQGRVQGCRSLARVSA